MKFGALACALVFVSTMVVAAGSLVTNEMIAIPGGAFNMGSSDGPDDERPAHPVDVARFEIDRLPVTNLQAAEFLNNGFNNSPA